LNNTSRFKIRIYSPRWYKRCMDDKKLLNQRVKDKFLFMYLKRQLSIETNVNIKTVNVR